MSVKQFGPFTTNAEDFGQALQVAGEMLEGEMPLEDTPRGHVTVVRVMVEHCLHTKANPVGFNRVWFQMETDDPATAGCIAGLVSEEF